MEYQIDHRPAYAVARIQLSAGEQITSEAGALVAHSEAITVETGVGESDEGLFESVKDSVLGGESLFRNTYLAEGGDGEVTLAPTLPGDVEVVELDGERLFIQSGGYVAAADGMSIDTDIGGLDTLLGGEGLFFLEASGRGPLFLASFGGIREREVAPGETFTVDSGHVVAWDGDMEYATESVGGLKTTLFSDEGLVMRFTGPGTVMVQTRSYEKFLTDIVSQIPSGNGDGGGFDMDF